MLRVHTAEIEGTFLSSGHAFKGQSIMVTSTMEKSSATIVVSPVQIIQDGDDFDITLSVQLIYPDMSEIGFTQTEIKHVGDVETMQQRENRVCKIRNRKKVIFPRLMGLKTVPVLAVSKGN